MDATAAPAPAARGTRPSSGDRQDADDGAEGPARGTRGQHSRLRIAVRLTAPRPEDARRVEDTGHVEGAWPTRPVHAPNPRIQRAGSGSAGAERGHA